MDPTPPSTLNNNSSSSNSNNSSLRSSIVSGGIINNKEAIIDPFDARSIPVQPAAYTENDPTVEFFCTLYKKSSSFLEMLSQTY